jgi:hypothetical protein
LEHFAASGTICYGRLVNTEIFKTKWFRGLGVLAAVLIAGGAYFIHDYTIRQQAYEGTITNTFKKLDWMRFFRKRRTDTLQSRKQYNYYWVVEHPDGSERTVEVYRTLWEAGTTGTPVRKYRGGRYPIIDTEEGQRNRALKDQTIGNALNALTGQ